MPNIIHWARGTGRIRPHFSIGCQAQETLSHTVDPWRVWGRTAILASNKQVDVHITPTWQTPGKPGRLQGLVVQKRNYLQLLDRMQNFSSHNVHKLMDMHFLSSTIAPNKNTNILQCNTKSHWEQYLIKLTATVQEICCVMLHHS